MTTFDRHLLRASWRSWLSPEGPDVGPRWLLWVWTLLFAAVLAGVFTILGYFAFGHRNGGFGTPAGWALWYARNLVVCVTISALIHLMFSLTLPWARSRLSRWHDVQRTLYFAGVPMLGVAIGWPLGILLAGGDLAASLLQRDALRMVVGSILMSVLIAFLLHHWFAARSREQETRRRASEAQLRLLQAQIEPHFLFNTLANVQALIDDEPGKARAMLDAFTDYLRASLGGLRGNDGTLGSELDLAEAYLCLLGTRMGARLRYTIDVPPPLRTLRLPPLLLQPLVENAIVHGLEPAVDGGHVHITARREGDVLSIEVRDDGRGLDAPPRHGGRRGAGMALANVRERLAVRFSGRAEMVLQSASPGTVARLRLPVNPA